MLNKVSDADPLKVAAARQIVRSLNADARIIETDYADCPAGEILNTGRFDFSKAHEHPFWAKELYGFADHTPETEEYGVQSFVFRARRPFVPEKIHKLLNGPLTGVIRAKGHFWLATRPDWVAEFSLAGALSSVSPLGRWWASVPQNKWPEDPRAVEYARRQWTEPFGDRRQEIVFIGAGIDWPRLRNRLEACLVSVEDGNDLAAFSHFPDPFPNWQRGEQAA